VVAAGDVDGDGTPDVIAGAPGVLSPDHSGLAGSVFVYSGRDQHLIQTLTAPPQREGQNRLGGSPQPEGALFGCSVATADLNHDHRADMIVGAPNGMMGGGPPGMAYAFFSSVRRATEP